MEKINKLRKILVDNKLDGYLIPKNDEFFGEYTSDHNDRLKYITNFSGSYGFSLITKRNSYLFVDGRYTLQAERQSGKAFKVFTFPKKMPFEFIKSKKLSIGFDPKLFTSRTLNIFFGKNNCKFIPLKKNLIDQIWKRKVIKKNNKFYSLPINSVGDGYLSKINKVASFIKKKGADFQFITSSENNAWLLNIRGQDTKFAPIPNCLILIDKSKNIKIFCDLKKISVTLKKKFKRAEFISIKLASSYLGSIKNKKFIFDENTCSIYFENIILNNNKIVKAKDHIYFLKAVKNKKEIENMKIAHIHDGVALTKYLFWIKKNFNKKKITEITASKKLYQFRKKNFRFKALSFPTISGTGPNGAIIHYKATKKTNRKLKKGDIYLVDSGGQYKYGTTDVTRTICFSKPKKNIKNIFTRVLKGHIAVVKSNLNKYSSGNLIDFRARKFLKEINLDYQHGTGHGVGFFLNVHEGPQGISKFNKIKLLEGMVLSNEPGYYKKDKFGIRIENLIYIKKNKNKLCFENLTLAPIDKDLINFDLLTNDEKSYLWKYNLDIYTKLHRYLNPSEKRWLATFIQ